MHRDRVHDPRHRLGVRADVGRRDVRVGTDDPLELGREAPRHGLQLLRAHRGRVAGDAALRAAERDVDEGALPGHPHRERADVVEVGRGVEAEAALGRSTRDVVLDPIALEDLERAVVALHREVDGVLTLRHAQDRPDAGLEGEVVGGGVELRERGCQRIGAGRPRDRGRGSIEWISRRVVRGSCASTVTASCERGRGRT